MVGNARLSKYMVSMGGQEDGPEGRNYTNSSSPVPEAVILFAKTIIHK